MAGLEAVDFRDARDGGRQQQHFYSEAAAPRRLQAAHLRQALRCAAERRRVRRRLRIPIGSGLSAFCRLTALPALPEPKLRRLRSCQVRRCSAFPLNFRDL